VRAAVITAPGSAELRRLPTPYPGPGEVLVELEGCGLCGSDLPVWQGRPWFDYPREPGAPGHEGWGRIAAAGDGVRDLPVGTRVAAISHRADAEFDVARADAVVRLPEELDGQPFPGEALGCAMNIFARSRIESGQTVAIVGVGFLGAILTRLASRAGARVITLSRRRDALDIAEQMGAAVTIPLEDHHAILREVGTLTRGRFCERVIEATGKAWPLDLAGELTGEGGRLMIAGYHQDGPRTINMQLWNYRGFDVINAHERDPQVSLRGMRAAVAAIEEGVFDPRPLYRVYPFADMRAAFEAARDRPPGFVKAILRMEARS
jgi:threonine dehydrogenase-like Zn-dependent dehydrogenase